MTLDIAPPLSDARTRSRRDLLAAGLTCLTAVPVAAWWLVGDPTPQAPAGTRLTYDVPPPALPIWAEHLIGTCALLAAVASMALLIRAFRQRRFDRRWWPPLGALMLAEILLAALWRALTAGTVGTRPGGGWVMVALGMPMLWLLVWSVTWTVWLLLRRPGSASRTRRHHGDGGIRRVTPR